eukprot:COSAG02_NODE_3133_length_7308_cov_5.304064_5_plen_85_part_00
MHLKHQNGDDLVQNFLSDGTVLVYDSSNRGKGSPTYVDSARLLGAAELKTIDDFISVLWSLIDNRSVFRTKPSKGSVPRQKLVI